MNTEQAKALVKKLAGLFPNQLTQEQARYAAKNFLPFDAVLAEKAVNAHRGQHEFVNWPNLWEGCNAAARDAQRGNENARKEGTWADVYRRQWPDLSGASDLEVAIRVHRGWWHKSPQNDSSRRQFRDSCVNCIRASVPDISEASAGQWADTIFYPAEDFRRVLDDLRHPAAA